MRSIPRVGAFKMHLVLTVLVCLWLTLAEYVIEVSFVVTVAVVAALVLASGTFTSIRINQLSKYCQQEVLAARQTIVKTKEELHQVITMLPSLRAMYDALCPLEANTTYVMYEFSRWLNWALNPQHTNVMEWLQTCLRSKGTALSELYGVCDHLSVDRSEKEYAVTQGAYRAYMDTELLRGTQRQPGEGDEQTFVRGLQPTEKELTFV